MRSFCPLSLPSKPQSLASRVSSSSPSMPNSSTHCDTMPASISRASVTASTCSVVRLSSLPVSSAAWHSVPKVATSLCTSGNPSCARIDCGHCFNCAMRDALAFPFLMSFMLCLILVLFVLPDRCRPTLRREMGQICFPLPCFLWRL